MSKQVSLENMRPGGFGLPTGQVVPGYGSIAVEPEVWGACKDHPVVKAQVDAGALIVDGKGKKKAEATADRDENGDTAEMAEMRQRFDAAFAAVTTELDAEKAKVAELENAVADRDAEITALKQNGRSGSLKAEHHGGGKFNVTEGETVHLSGLSKADADAFNAMSDDDKAKYVELNKAN
jgi:hypothetical protein